MLLEFKEEFCSIKKGGRLELPSFVVLSGLNGTGKTHLLSAILQKKVCVKNAGVPVEQIRYIPVRDLMPGPSVHCAPEQSDEAYNVLIKWSDSLVLTGQDIDDREKYSKRTPGNMNINNNRKDASKLLPALKKILEASFDRGKRQITKSEVRTLVANDEFSAFDKEILFQQEFATSFLRYVQDYRDNKIQRILRDHEGEDVSALSDEEFYNLKGRPPWELINRMFKVMDLPYFINQPMSAENTFVANLTNTLSGTTIKFSDLSSGERALCCLAIAMYQSGRGQRFPELLLLDEPDAHLHPSMIAGLIDALQTAILPRLSCGLLMTTHSPTTCAIAPISSLFLMNGETRRPEPMPLDDALDALCVGLPTLSVRKEHERQVVVESDIDADIYTRLWSRLKTNIHTGSQRPVTLNFISSGSKDKSGSCENAIDLCERLRAAGSTTCFALIDFDCKNISTGPLHVLGETRGYSIESFILSPILILALLSHRHGSDGMSPSYMKSIDFVEFGALSSEEIQRYTTLFCDQLKSFCKASRTGSRNKFPKIKLDESEDIVRKDVEGRLVRLPRWFALSNGHAIEELIVESHQSLKIYGNKNGDLMRAVVNHVLCSHEGLMPECINSAFLGLCK